MITQKDKVLSLLMTGHHYTVVDFLRYGCGTEGRKHISDLKSEGYEISSGWVVRDGKKWKEYYMDEYADN